ncbi:MAG: prepilin-type N-terminal cleavage/methylation domain-containing protein [Caldisericaceae bacterium]
MAKISAYRRGFTVIEISIVIAIILIIAIPVSVFIANYSQGFIVENIQVKEQYYLNIILQDLEQRIRRADANSIAFDTTNKILNFTYIDAEIDGSKKTTLYCRYVLENPQTDNAIFKRAVSTDSNTSPTIFPPGLEKGIIYDFNVQLLTTDTCTITLTSKTDFVLQKTIYLLNY